MTNGVNCEWVVGKFDGARAVSIEAHVAEGLGYFILDSNGRGNSKEVIAAFRRVIDGPTPEHLEHVTDPVKITKYEKMLDQRHSRNDKSLKVTRAGDDTIARVRTIFEQRDKKRELSESQQEAA